MKNVKPIKYFESKIFGQNKFCTFCYIHCCNKTHLFFIETFKKRRIWKIKFQRWNTMVHTWAWSIKWSSKYQRRHCWACLTKYNSIKFFSVPWKTQFRMCICNEIYFARRLHIVRLLILLYFVQSAEAILLVVSNIQCQNPAYGTFQELKGNQPD